MSISLVGRTILITGASRGIGREIALSAAAKGANIVIAAKSDIPHPKLPGTIHSVAAEIRALGGQALPVKLDVRDDESIAQAIDSTAKRFGRLDALVNNAGAIRLEQAATIDMKRFDLIQQINTRAVLAMSKAALPLLEESDNAHIFSMSPPLNLRPQWLEPYIPYTVTKYGMTLLALGMAEELRRKRIAVNTLWPRTTIATAAVEFEVGKDYLERSRKPKIVADAACEILSTPSTVMTGQTLIDEVFLRKIGQMDFEQYRNGPKGIQLALDLFVDA